MSRFTFAKRGRRAAVGRRVAALGAVGLGACVVLAACSPVQVGSAAIVGNQRITVSSLDTQVSNLQTALNHYGNAIPGQTPVRQSPLPGTVLSWLIRFSVMDQVAATSGISISQSQTDAALSSLNGLARQDGIPNATELLVANGVPPQLIQQAGRWYAQTVAYQTKANHGKPPSTQNEQNTVNTAFNKAECTAAKSLNIQISPQFGRFDYTAANFGVVPAADVLSRTAGTPSPASTEGLTPAC